MATYPTSNVILTQPLAAQAGDGKRDIPNTTTDRGRFSQAQGFPTETGLPIAQGGVPPVRADFNGAFYMLSALLYYAQTGGQWKYDSTMTYHKPAIVYDTDGNLYFCLSTTGTSTQPSTDTSHTNWTPLNIFLNGSNVVAFKGSVTNYSDLPASATAGDVYNVTSQNKNYCWSGSEWKDYGTTVDLSAYLTITSAQATYLTIAAAANKANIDGYYDLLTSGFAENLVGRDDGTVQTFTKRATGGSTDVSGSTATINAVRGNTVVWNQYAPLHSGQTSPQLIAVAGTASYDDGITTFTLTQDVSYRTLYRYNNVYTMPRFIIGHKYYLSHTVKGTLAVTIGWIYGSVNPVTVTENWQKVSAVYTENSNTNSRITIYCTTDLTAAEHSGETVQIKNAIICDLTAMFGSGNEPTTAAEFEALFPLDYYSYDAGSLLNLTATGVKTVGFNAYNPSTGTAVLLGGNQYQITGTYTSLSYSTGETITPSTTGTLGLFTPTADGTLTVTGGNDTDTCVHLVHSGYRNGEWEEYWDSTRSIPISTYFSDGMKSAGTVYDELEADKATKRIGKVDLGTLTWSIDSTATATTGTVYTAAIPSDCKVGSASVVSKLACAKYSADTETNILAGTTNNTIGTGATAVKVYTQTTYTDAAAFKTAMSGVYLYYELATPTETTITPPLNLSYKVDDFGTEQELPVNTATPTTSPFKAEIAYGLNAVDTIRNLPKNYISKDSLDQLITTLSTVYGITITPTYDTTNKKYTFTASGGLTPVSAKPASYTATGTKGNYYFDGEEYYLYLCVATNQWRRIPLVTW